MEKPVVVRDSTINVRIDIDKEAVDRFLEEVKKESTRTDETNKLLRTIIDELRKRKN